MYKDSNSSPILTSYMILGKYFTLFSAWYPHLFKKKEYAKINDIWYIKDRAQSRYMA